MNPLHLIVGLGNPTAKYENTRHNVGFMVLDSYINHHCVTFNNNKQFNAKIAIINRAILIQPQTYMNLSGISVRSVRDFYKIDNSKILVIHDDLDLKFGTLRFKYAGSSGGHNGLKSLDNHIGNDYMRARIGIGRPQNNITDSKIQSDVIDYVLETFSKIELESLENILISMQSMIDSFVEGDSLAKLQNKYTRNI